MASSVFIQEKGLKSISIELSNFPKQIPGATASALNRTLSNTITNSAREVTQKYAIKNGDVKSTIKAHKASKSNLYAYMESRGPTIALSKFPYKPKKYSKKAKVVSVKVQKSGYKAINTSPKAFVQTMNGATHIWKREGSRRTPVVLLRTLSVPQMLSNPETIKRIQDTSAKKLEERIEHEIKWRLDKAAAKGSK
ncbi:phage tail protein [Clostridium cylindrosporum]|uniref:Prophage minor tail protein Z n=1 Tax=Clostridium cylindrosporum DSM 605 TaxID=1121307 RepID=A0A0J8DAF8_CLOCY|nr:phage tail protein [Clostridium cylindrosporum]KMT23005.1 prophage minor tail protein Z [Clostridium cylindrosporum DSM 605]